VSPTVRRVDTHMAHWLRPELLGDVIQDQIREFSNSHNASRCISRRRSTRFTSSKSVADGRGLALGRATR